MLFSLVNQTSSSAVGGESMGSLIRKAIKEGRLFGKYKNFNFIDEIVNFNALGYNDIGMTRFHCNTRSGAKRAKKDVIFNYSNAQRRETKALNDIREIEIKPSIMFCINDIKVAGDKYLHYYIQEEISTLNTPTVYLIHRNERDIDSLAVVNSAKKLLADLGNPPMILLSSLVTKYASIFTARQAARGARKSRAIGILGDNFGKRTRRSNGWSKAWNAVSDEEMAAPIKYYVATEKMVATQTGFSDAWQLLNFVNNVRASGHFGLNQDTPVFGIRKGHKVIKNNSGEWVELMSHVFHQVPKFMTAQKTQALSLYIKPFNSEYSELLKYIAAKKPFCNSPVQDFALALEEAKSVQEPYWASTKEVLDFCEERGKYIPKLVTDFNAKWRKIVNNYPMLQYISGWEFRDKNNRLNAIEYIQMVDNYGLQSLAKGVAFSIG